MIKNVIFDLDGVIRGIKNTPILEILPEDLKEKYHKQYQNDGLCDFVGRYLPLPIFQEWDKGIVLAEDVLQEILNQSNEPDEVIKEVFYSVLNPEHNFVYFQTVEFIKYLKSKGCKIFLLSNMCKEVVDILPKFLDLTLFDSAMFSCDIGLRKPDKQFYIAALKKFNIDALSSIFIDDSIKNLYPFEELGGKTFLFDNANIGNTLEKLDKLIQENGSN